MPKRCVHCDVLIEGEGHLYICPRMTMMICAFTTYIPEHSWVCDDCELQMQRANQPRAA